MIKFLPTSQDPSKPENNEIKEIYEGYLEKGGYPSQEHYGRMFDGYVCQIGFLINPSTTDPFNLRFKGKGMKIKFDGQVLEEGLYTETLDTV